MKPIRTVFTERTVARIWNLWLSARGGSGTPSKEGCTTTTLVAGGLLSFGLSFDEIIVTTFTAGAGQTTLPIWIFQNLFRPNQAPIVNVVAAALIVISIVPIYLSQRLTQERK